MIATVGHAAFGSLLQDSGAIADALANAPFMLELNGRDWRSWLAVSSVQIDDTLGQPRSCQFVLINPSTTPKPGDLVRVLYYAEVLFAGMMSRVEPQPNTPMNVVQYQCEATDWSVLLVRRRLRRNFTNVPVVNIIDSILDNEVAGEGLSIGTIDQGPTIPLVDARNARIFDVLRDVAGATGQSMSIDADKRVHIRSTSGETAPIVIDETTVEASSLVEDLETYRNVQTVIVTGTPAVGTEEKRTVTIVRQNAEQIAARQAIEGGTGRYEDIEEVTHPTSNDAADLALMGIGYANLRLATSGVPRTTLAVRLRGYGFRAGQVASVNLPAVGAVGTWLIQRASAREQHARHLVYDLELTRSGAQQRAYEAWLNIVRAGKVVVQLPSAVTNNLAVFNTPGSYTWTAPVSGLVEFTCYGGSGGAGGKWAYTQLQGHQFVCTGVAYGGAGGNSGKAVTTLSVVAGQVYDVIVGAAGLPGSNGHGNLACAPTSVAATGGTAGSSSQVKLGALVKCQGDGGGGGGAASGDDFNGSPGAPGSPGSGIGDAVTVGGGKSGGANAPDPQSGQDGLVEIRW
jgi:hypothetical protein